MKDLHSQFLYPAHLQPMDEKIVLLVEDERPLGAAMLELLQLYDVNAVWADTGEKAISLIDDKDIGLVICDMNLPDLTGYDILSHVKNNSRTQQLPFVILTAFADEKDKKKGLESGATAYLAKPIPSKVLMETIRSLMN